MKKKSTIKLRDYQARDVERILSAFPTKRRVMYQLPVGGGKTVVASAVMATITGRVLVLAHRSELLTQMARTASGFGLGADRVKLLSPCKAARLSDAELSSFGLVVVDEAHRAGGPEYRSVLERATSPILGLSASPYRREGLDTDFDDLLVGPSVDDLIAGGHIVAARCWSVPEEREPVLDGVKSIGGDYRIGELERAVNKPHLVGDIVREWSEHAKGRSTLVFATSIKHASSIATAFCAANIDARIVHGKTPAAERSDMLKDFEAGLFPVLVNVLLLTEGIDIKRIDCLVLARPTRSIVLFIQAIGRAMRPSPTGLSPIVLDHSGAVRRHGLPTMPREWSLSPAPKNKGRGAGGGQMAKQCSACGTMTHLSAIECAHCGAAFRVVNTEARLEEVQERKCVDCSAALSQKSKGKVVRCKSCTRKHVWASKSQGERLKIAANISAATDKEQRKDHIKKVNASRSMDSRSVASKKAWLGSAYRRAALSARTSRMMSAMSSEERSELARRAAAAPRSVIGGTAE